MKKLDSIEGEKENKPLRKVEIRKCEEKNELNFWNKVNSDRDNISHTKNINSDVKKTKYHYEGKNKLVYEKKQKNILRKPGEFRLNAQILSSIVLSKNKIYFMDALRIYVPQVGCYKRINNQELKTLIYKTIDPDYKCYARSYDIEDTVRLIGMTPGLEIDVIEKQKKHYEYINCLNGVIRLKNLEVHEHDKEKYFIGYVNANYYKNYSIEGTNFCKFINCITNGDAEMKKMLRQIMGYCFSNYNNAKKAFLFYGESNSGKSVFLRLISSICGEENISNIPLQLLDDERYTAELFGKTLNIYNELPEYKIKDTGVFKSLVSETDKVIARPLYRSPFSFYNKSKLIFATNNLPKINASGHGDHTAFFNRLIVIHFMNSIPEDKQDKDLFKKLEKEKDIIFSWAIDGLKEYIKNDFNFAICRKSYEIMNIYKRGEDAINSFLTDSCIFDDKVYVHKYMLDEAYLEYCEEQGFKLPNNNDLRNLKNIILCKYKCQYKRINRGGENKYGFEGLCLRKKY